MKLYFALMVLSFSLFIGGCGQKGPLYLPAENQQSLGQPDQESSVSTEETDESKKADSTPTEEQK